MESSDETLSDINPPLVVRQLFIGNLSYRLRWQDVKDLFKKAGHVVRADVAMHGNNQSKGHGFVLYTCVEDAQKAIDMFHRYKWSGRVIEVRADNSYTEDDKSIDSTDDDCKQLFVGNWRDLKDLFKKTGPVVRADIAMHYDGQSRGFGTVLFNTHQDAKDAIGLYNGYRFHNRILKVHFDKFEAGRQKCTEDEKGVFELREINDPASVELLRQTYATPTYPTTYSNYYNTLYAYNAQQWVPPPPPPLPLYLQESEMLSLSASLDNINLNQGSAGLRDNVYSWYI
ncbi:hypothetical protein INT48_004635 [Thamnidium elegans]|uniref:RRM domain-containing protein n=1 Tax=Thamnidium elegans TaxID=101142 RepID=A0A8H7SZN0_9FUNG|nr:hypothetical protein INT48_004635 [Thamnidium elegans]